MANTVDALRKIRDTVASHRRAIILEVMGNTSGWIALAAGIAGGASAILMPEFPQSYDPQSVVARCVSALRNDYRYFIIVMAEGVKAAAQNQNYGPNLARHIENNAEIAQVLGHPMSVRYNVIGHLTRGGTPTAFDNVLAARFARGAVSAILDDISLPDSQDLCVALDGKNIIYRSLQEVTQLGPRLIQPTDELFLLHQDLMVQETQLF